MPATAERQNVDSLNEALRLLDEAAQQSGSDVKQLIEEDYQHLKNTIEEISPKLKTAVGNMSSTAKRSVQNATEASSQFAKEQARQVDAHAHENPWAYVGGAALAGGLLGYFLAQSNERS